MGEQLEFKELNTEEIKAPEAPQPEPFKIPEPEPEKQKGKRGRKAGVPNKPKASSGNDEDFFNKATEAANEQKTKTTEAPAPAPAIEAVTEKPSLITGYMLLVICDAVIPAIIGKFIAKKTGTKKQIKKLEKGQLEEMRPLADAAAKKMFENVSEVPAFFIAYACVTFSNQIE